MINLTEDNFLLYAAKHYDNPHCMDEEEFQSDMMKFFYLSRLFKKYDQKGVLKERLILNHLIVLYNLFGGAATQMLFLRLYEYKSYLKTFLVFLGRMPEEVRGVNGYGVIRDSEIPLDQGIAKRLRELENGE